MQVVKTKQIQTSEEAQNIEDLIKEIKETNKK